MIMVLKVLERRKDLMYYWKMSNIYGNDERKLIISKILLLVAAASRFLFLLSCSNTVYI